MANENNKPEQKKPRFNAYWIYIAIFLLFIGLQFFGGSSLSAPAKTTQADFQSYLEAGDVAKVEIINKKIARVYLTEEAKQKQTHSSKIRATCNG